MVCGLPEKRESLGRPVNASNGKEGQTGPSREPEARGCWRKSRCPCAQASCQPSLEARLFPPGARIGKPCPTGRQADSAATRADGMPACQDGVPARQPVQTARRHARGSVRSAELVTVPAPPGLPPCEPGSRHEDGLTCRQAGLRPDVRTACVPPVVAAGLHSCRTGLSETVPQAPSRENLRPAGNLSCCRPLSRHALGRWRPACRRACPWGCFCLRSSAVAVGAASQASCQACVQVPGEVVCTMPAVAGVPSCRPLSKRSMPQMPGGEGPAALPAASSVA